MHPKLEAFLRLEGNYINAVNTGNFTNAGTNGGSITFDAGISGLKAKIPRSNASVYRLLGFTSLSKFTVSIDYTPNTANIISGGGEQLWWIRRPGNNYAYVSVYANSIDFLFGANSGNTFYYISQALPSAWTNDVTQRLIFVGDLTQASTSETLKVYQFGNRCSLTVTKYGNPPSSISPVSDSFFDVGGFNNIANGGCTNGVDNFKFYREFAATDSDAKRIYTGLEPLGR